MMILDKYQKIKDLGEGAQGTVILARDTVLGRRIAIKSLHTSLSEDDLHLKRFKEEAKTLAGLDHPSIVTVYEYVANELGCHLMMEYFEGHPLNLYIKNITGPIPEDKAIDIFIKILEAMSYIHKKKIIHRDIKPSNIMINDHSEIRLLDFGIAKNTENDPTLTQVGASAGYTPMYMSPEHCNAEPISKYSDIYSLGVTLWQMVTGRAPYEGDTQGQIYLKVANEPLPSIQSVYENVSLKMNEIIQKATNKDPKKRFKSCDEFKKELVKLKSHIKELPTEFIHNIRVQIANGIKADIYINDECVYANEFSKSIEKPANSSELVKVVISKSGYKKIKHELYLEKNEKLRFKLEKKKMSFSSSLTMIKDSLIPYAKRIKPNILLLFIYFKQSITWLFNLVLLKLKKNNSETVKLTQSKNIKIKKSLLATAKSIKVNAKEYLLYLIFIILFSFSLCSLIGSNESVSDDSLPIVLPLVNFESDEINNPESEEIVRIPVLLSEASDSIVKIPLTVYGTATNNVDYKLKSDTISIIANKTLGYVDLKIINDTSKESDETIIIELIEPVNAKLGSKRTYTYVIVNDDINSTPTNIIHPARGTKASRKCIGKNRYQYYHDGNGGTYNKLLKKNSTYCGYKPATQTASTNSNLNSSISSDFQDKLNANVHDYYTDSFNGWKLIIDISGKDIEIRAYKNGKFFHKYDLKGELSSISYDAAENTLNTNWYVGAGKRRHLINLNNTSSPKIKRVDVDWSRKNLEIELKPN